MATGVLHVRISVNECWSKFRVGRLFLHEVPKGVFSWKLRCVQELEFHPDVVRVIGPMCRWSMSDKSEDGYGRKETSWLTNSPLTVT